MISSNSMIPTKASSLASGLTRIQTDCSGNWSGAGLQLDRTRIGPTLLSTVARNVAGISNILCPFLCPVAAYVRLYLLYLR